LVVACVVVDCVVVTCVGTFEVVVVMVEVVCVAQAPSLSPCARCAGRAALAISISCPPFLSGL
jgi:hypothetical protein